jgi:hypothetical protein
MTPEAALPPEPPGLGSGASTDATTSPPEIVGASGERTRSNVVPGGSLTQPNVTASGSLTQPNLTPSGAPTLPEGAYPAGAYSQADVDRAKSLSGLSALAGSKLAQKLAGAASGLGSTSSTQSSQSSNNTGSNDQYGGLSLGGSTQPNPSSSSSALSMPAIGTNSSPSSTSDEALNMIMPPRPKETEPTTPIEARFEIVVVCRKDDLLLQPGGYRLTSEVLKSAGQGPDSILSREIRAMVRKRAIVDPMIRQKPAIRFLVESQGAGTFALARQQLLFSLPDWPVSLQVAGSQNSAIFNRNPW